MVIIILLCVLVFKFFMYICIVDNFTIEFVPVSTCYNEKHFESA